MAYPQRPSIDDPNKKVQVDAEDCVTIIARMKSGAMGTLEASKIATGTEDELRLEIHGSRGAIRFDALDAHHLGAFDATAPDAPVGGTRGWTQIATGQRYPKPASGFPSPKATIGWTRGHVDCLAHFLDSVARGVPGNPGLDQGVYVQHVMDCAHRSARQRSWVALDEPLPK